MSAHQSLVVLFSNGRFCGPAPADRSQLHTFSLRRHHGFHVLIISAKVDWGPFASPPSRGVAEVRQQDEHDRKEKKLSCADTHIDPPPCKHTRETHKYIYFFSHFLIALFVFVLWNLLNVSSGQSFSMEETSDWLSCHFPSQENKTWGSGFSQTRLFSLFLGCHSSLRDQLSRATLVEFHSSHTFPVACKIFIFAITAALEIAVYETLFARFQINLIVQIRLQYKWQFYESQIFMVVLSLAVRWVSRIYLSSYRSFCDVNTWATLLTQLPPPPLSASHLPRTPLFFPCQRERDGEIYKRDFKTHFVWGDKDRVEISEIFAYPSSFTAPTIAFKSPWSIGLSSTPLKKIIKRNKMLHTSCGKKIFWMEVE